MFDCIIVGAGIAGLQCAIQLGRYRHIVLVLDANRGRSTQCRSYHNLLGWPEGVSGLELRRIGRHQAQELGVAFANQTVSGVQESAEGFTVLTDEDNEFATRTLLLATGVTDHIPPIPGIHAALGISIYVCPDCDGYECTNKITVVLGAGNTGAEMALTLKHWTPSITFINHLSAPPSPELLQRLYESGIRYVNSEIEHVECNASSYIQSIVLANGDIVLAERGFVAFGGNQVQSQLLSNLNAVLVNGKHVAVHPKTKMTSVKHLWAAGDVVAHSEQVSIAMGDGSQAAIFIHKALLGETIEGL